MPMGATPFPFGDCRVCTDKATGVHYGVATCEGCKGFFKRSIPKSDRYQCFFGGRCVVNPQNRNRCKACRFQRCVAVGMSIDAVKMGRIPKVNKERALAAHRPDDNASSPSDERPYGMPVTPSSSSSSSSLLPSSFLSQMRHHDLPPLMEAQHRIPLPSLSKQFSPADMPPTPHSVAPFDPSDNFFGGTTHDNESGEVNGFRDHTPHIWGSGDSPPQQVPRPCAPSWQQPPAAPQSISEPGGSPASSIGHSPMAVSPYSPTVIKELINQVIESGQGQELQQTLIRQFFKDEIPPNLKRKLPADEDLHEPPPLKQEVTQASDLQDDLFLFDLINTPFRRPSMPQQQPQPQHPSPPVQEEGFFQQLQLDLQDLDQYLGPSSNDTDARYLQRHSRLSLDTERAQLLNSKLLVATTSFMETLSRNKLLMREEVSGAREPHPMNTITHPHKQQVLFIWSQLMDSIPVSNFDVLGLCRGTPMFSDLDPKDQAILMEEAYFDIWLTMNTALFQKGDSYMRLPCDARYSRLWMQYFLPEKVVDEMFYYAEKINFCHLTQGEIITICTIQLTNPEHRGLSNRGHVSQLHQVYLSLLWAQLQESHQTSHLQVFDFLLQLLPMLGPLNKMQAEIVAKFQVDSPPDGVLRYTEEDGGFVNKEFD